jgi:uncharacterized delta-60 repeat protein
MTEAIVGLHLGQSRPSAASVAGPLAAAIVALALAIAPAADAAEGLLDPTFGSGGFALIDEPAFPDESLNDLFIQSDGKILMAGTRGGAHGFLLTRFDPNGAPDLSFGPGGFQIVADTEAEGGARAINDIIRRSDGKIVAVGLGRGKEGNDAFGFARYLPSGILDSEFGDEGLKTLSPGEPGEPGEGVSLDLAPDGKIVAVGFRNIAPKAAVLRLTDKGEPDSTFAPNPPVGFRLLDVPGSPTSFGSAVKTLNDGAVLVGGESEAGAFLAKLDQNGEPVAGFGAAGFFVEDLGQAPAPTGEFTELAVLPDGRILAVGSADTAIEGDELLVVARLTAGGDLDPSFGSGGIFRLNPTPSRDRGEALAVLPDGRILIAGSHGASKATGDTWILRLTPDGQLDPSFGTGGQTVASATTGFDGARGLAVQPDGRSVIVGEAANVEGPSEALAGRFTGPEPAQVTVVPTKARCAGKKATTVGTAKADKLRGTKKVDVIAGLGGNDKVRALAGNDIVCGGKGKDTIDLGKGRDQARGEGGADTLKGGPGKDKLLGGDGRDKLLGGPGPDLCNGGGGKDAKAGGCERRKKLP